MAEIRDYDGVPETVAEALARWDAEEIVWSVEMGGLGPGYEMSIQGLAFELMREFQLIDEWADDEKFGDWLDAKARRIISEFNKESWGGFSGAQAGAATNLACAVCRKGYRAALRDDKVKDRLIQVCKKDLRGYQPKGSK